MRLMDIATRQLVPSKLNPRTDFSDTDGGFKRSIEHRGITKPLLVSRVGNHQYEIVDGERRWRIAKELNLPTVPCLVDDFTEASAIDARLISHLQRANLHPWEEAEFFGVLSSPPLAQTVAEIAVRSGKPASYIAQRLKLLDLIPRARTLFASNTITLDHATLLARMTADDQKRALEWLVGQEYTPTDRSGYGPDKKLVDVAKDIKLFRTWVLSEISLNLSVAPFDKADTTLVPGVIDCLHCPKNSGYNTALFAELSTKHVCGDRACFNAKVAAHLAREKQRVRKEEKLAFIMVSSTQLEMDDPLKVEGVKMAGRYKVVKAGDACDDTKRAQWIDGPNAGKFTLVCNYSKCKKHWKESVQRSAGGERFDDPKQVAKRKLAEKDADYTRAVADKVYVLAVKEVVDRSDGRLGTYGWQALAATLLDQWSFNLPDQIPVASLAKRVGSMKPRQLEKLTLEMLMLQEIGDGEQEITTKLARVLGVSLGDIMREIERGLHKCEVCHCSEITPCDKGCSWDKKFLQANRYVCSTCPPLAKPLKKPEAKG